MQKYLLGLIISFFVALFLAPFVIKLTRKLKFGQTILKYVDLHSQKQGTPTMGGIIFILAIVVMMPFCMNHSYSMVVLATVSMLGFGIIGFLDDYIKIRYKQNLGLRPYQKIIGQLGVATALALYCYFSSAVGTKLVLPFTDKYVDVGFWIIPFVVVIFLAITNSVNLTDGLDGLAGGVSLVYILGVSVLIMFQINGSEVAQNELSNLVCLCFVASGAILAYLLFNMYPAKIFMGDTGSLALGGLIGSVTIFSGLELYMPILGVMFVASSVSVIIQVLHFKRTKKRVFLMAPLHHHFEKKGVHENRISLIYIVITTIVCLTTILVEMYV